MLSEKLSLQAALEEQEREAAKLEKVKASEARNAKQAIDAQKARAAEVKERKADSTPGLPAGMVVHDVPADGNCLYASISANLIGETAATPMELRTNAVTYFREHKDSGANA